MAPILMREIINFTSEDSRFPANNILEAKKWLTEERDTSSKAVVEIQLNVASQICYIDIGYINVASLEIKVGRSSWPSSQEQISLLSTVMLQTPLEARAGKNKSGCRMFNHLEHLNSQSVNQKWDRVKVYLNQPFVKGKQIGLEFIRFASAKNSSNTADVISARSWRASPIAKLANPFTSMEHRTDLNNLENKLLRISSTTKHGSDEKNALTRTAKMVLASRSQQRSVTQKKLFPSPAHRKSNSFSSTTFQDSSPSSSIKRLADETPAPNKSNYFSSTTFQDSSPSSSVKKTANQTPNKIYDANFNCMERLQDPNTPSTSGMKKPEIKKLKHKINLFLNKLDMDELNQNSITLKDLRLTFEALNNVQLDKDGRNYFKNVTTSFAELALKVREHKQKKLLESKKNDKTPERKRKSVEIISVTSRDQSPAKLRRISSPDVTEVCIERPSTSNRIQCPICMKMFDKAIISDHAALCGDDVITDNEVEILSVTSPPASTMRIHPGETIIDLSDNMRLTEEEKQYWLNFSRQPKAFHPRMNKEILAGSRLMKCPTCGQFYKESEIEKHAMDCADKVNSGFERRGLYYVKKN